MMVHMLLLQLMMVHVNLVADDGSYVSLIADVGSQVTLVANYYVTLIADDHSIFLSCKLVQDVPCLNNNIQLLLQICLILVLLRRGQTRFIRVGHNLV